MNFIFYFLVLIGFVDSFSFVNLSSDVPADTSVFALSHESMHREAKRVGAYIEISNPGYYYLISDINVPYDTPAVDNIPIIKISSSNVILNLNRHVITHNKGKNLVGIQIEKSLTNIKINGDGAVNKIIGTGLLIKGGNESIDIEDLTLSNIEGNPARILKTNIVNFFRINVLSCSNLSGDISGLYFEGCKNIRISDAEILTCKSRNYEVSGVFLNKCSTGSIVNSRSVQHEGKNCNGYKSLNTEYFLFNQARSLNNNSYLGHVAGFYLENAISNRVINCSSIGEQGMDGNCYGVACVNGNSNIVEGCSLRSSILTTFNNNLFSAGIYLKGSERYTLVDNNSIISNSGGLGTGHGIFLDGVQFCTISNNRILYNRGQKNGFGIKDNSLKSKNFFYSNLAHGNGVPEKCIINNYDICPSPYEERSKFPSEIGLLSDFSSVDAKNSFKNYEFIEEKK